MRVCEVIDDVGGFGRYQKLKIMWLLLLGISDAMHLVGSVFLSAFVNFRCRIPHVLTDEWTASNQSLYNQSVRPFIPLKEDGSQESCLIYIQDKATGLPTNQTMECTDFVYDRSQFTETAVTQFDLVCSRTALSTLAHILYMAGLLIGSLTCGAVSDRWGRKPTVVISKCVTIVAALALIFSPNYAFFTAFRFIVGVGTIGAALSSFILVTEILPTTSRHLFIIIGGLMWCVSLMLLSGFAYAIRDWRYLQVAFTCMTIPAVGLYWVLDESPTWLVARERYDEAAVILKKIAKTNRCTYKNYKLNKDETVVSEKLSSVFRSRTLVLNVLINGIGWFTASMGYYGLTLNVGNLVGDIYVNNFVSGLVELPAYLLLLITGTRVGRKWPYVSMTIFGGVTLIISSFLIVYKSNDDLDWLIVMVSMIGKFFVSCAYSLIYFWCVEMYPTTLRNSLLGANSMCARIGAMLSPITADIPRLVDGVAFSKGIAPLIFGGFMLVDGLLSILLPETNGVPLPETIKQAAQMVWNHKNRRRVADHDSNTTVEGETKFN